MATDLNLEVTLDSDISPAAPQDTNTEPSSIFLTGSTGFLGAFLLHELDSVSYLRKVVYVRIPPMDAELFHAYISHLTSIGAINPPK